MIYEWGFYRQRDMSSEKIRTRFPSLYNCYAVFNEEIEESKEIPLSQEKSVDFIAHDTAAH